MFFEVYNKIAMCNLTALFEPIPCAIDVCIDKSINNKVIQVVIFDDTWRNQVITELDKFGFGENGHEIHV